MFKNLKLATKLNFFTISLILGTALGIALFGLRVEIKMELAELIENSRSVAALTARNSEYAVYTEDQDSLEQIKKSLFNTPGIVYMAVFKKDMTRLFKSAKDPYLEIPPPTTQDYPGLPAPPFHERFINPADGYSYITIVAPVISFANEGLSGHVGEMPAGAGSSGKKIASEPTAIGYLQLGISEKKIRERIQDFLFSIVIFTVFVMIAGILATFFITKRITSPIKKLSGLAQIVAKGDFTQKSDLRSKDELGQLADTFNQMILKRKEAEEELSLLNRQLNESFVELERAKAFTDNVIRSMIESLIVVTAEARILEVNQATCDLTGYQKHELLGQPLTLIIKKKENNEDLLEGLGLDELRKRGFITNVEKDFISKNGKEIPVLFSASVMRDSQGKSQGIVCVAQDITERKRSEKETQEMQIKMIAASKLATLGEVATGVAHEINQPLTYISGFLQGLKKNLRTGAVEEEKITENLKYAFHQIGRIVSIIDHLRTFGRRHDAKLERVNLVNVLDNSLLLLGERIRLKNIRLVRRVDENPPLILGNAHQLEQVFINLFQNAIEAFGGEPEDPTITVDMALSGDKKNIQIKFADNGAGIDSPIQEKIFEPFFTTKAVGEGTGLGLSIVYGIIKDHQGSITCESKINQGTTFTVIIPARE